MYFERVFKPADMCLSGPKTRETSLLIKEVSSGLSLYLCVSLTWQITLIWIPMHPGVKGGVHFGMGRGAFSERGGAFEMCLFTFVVYILASNRKKHKGIRRKLAELFVKKQKLRLAAGRSFCMQWCVDQNLAICSGVMEVTVATASLTVSSKS